MKNGGELGTQKTEAHPEKEKQQFQENIPSE